MIAKENNIGTLKSLKKQNKPDTEGDHIEEFLNESRLEKEANTSSYVYRDNKLYVHYITNLGKYFSIEV